MAEINYMLQKNDDDKYLKLSEFDSQGELNYKSKIFSVNVVGDYKVLNNVLLTDSNTKSATIDIDGVSTECFELTDDKITEINTKLAKQGRGLNFNSSTSQLEVKIVGVGSDGEQHIEEGGNAVSGGGAVRTPFSTDYNFKTITHIYIIGITEAETEKVTLEFNNTHYLDEDLPDNSIIQYLSSDNISVGENFSVRKLDNNSLNISGFTVTGNNSKVYCMVYELLD